MEIIFLLSIKSMLKVNEHFNIIANFVILLT